jgi:hypothetical protein
MRLLRTIGTGVLFLLRGALFLLRGAIYTILYLWFLANKWIWWCLLQPFPDGDEIDERVGEVYGNGTKDNKRTLNAIYQFFGTLDAKASALMRFNGIILAVIALILQSGGTVPPITYVVVYMTLASILACLLVVGVFWRFLEWVNTGTNALDDELHVIRRVLVMREVAYQVAWWLAGVVSILLIIHFADFVKP